MTTRRKKGWKKIGTFPVNSPSEQHYDVPLYLDDAGRFLATFEGIDYQDGSLPELKKRVAAVVGEHDHLTWRTVIEYVIETDWRGDEGNPSKVSLEFDVLKVSDQMTSPDEDQRWHKPRPRMKLEVDVDAAGNVTDRATTRIGCHVGPARPTRYTGHYEHTIDFTVERYLKLVYVRNGLRALRKILREVLGNGAAAGTRIDGFATPQLPAYVPPQKDTLVDDDIDDE